MQGYNCFKTICKTTTSVIMCVPEMSEIQTEKIDR